MVKTFDLDIGNTSGHIPVKLNTNCSSGLLEEEICGLLEEEICGTTSHKFSQF